MVVAPNSFNSSAGPSELSAPWVRVGGIFGLVTVAVLLGGAILLGGSNTLNDTSTSTAIANYVAAHQSSLVELTVVTVVGSALGLWFLATVATLIRASDPRSPLAAVALCSGVVATSLSAWDGVTMSALVFLHRQGAPNDPTLVRAFFDLQNGLLMPGLFGGFIATFLIAVGVAITRGGLTHRWVGPLAVVLGAVSVVGSVDALLRTGGGTSTLGYAPVLSYGAVTLLLSVTMLSGQSRTRIVEGVRLDAVVPTTSRAERDDVGQRT